MNMIPNKLYEDFLLQIYKELTSKKTPYRFGYLMYHDSGSLRPTLRLSVAYRDFRGKPAIMEVPHHEPKEAYIEYYRKLCRKLNRSVKAHQEA